jgi:hypothetical protein
MESENCEPTLETVLECSSRHFLLRPQLSPVWGRFFGRRVLGRVILGLPTSFPCGARKQVIDNRRRYLQFAVLPHAFSIVTGALDHEQIARFQVVDPFDFETFMQVVPSSDLISVHHSPLYRRK